MNNKKDQIMTCNSNNQNQNKKGLCWIHALHKSEIWDCDLPNTCPIANVLAPQPKKKQFLVLHTVRGVEDEEILLRRLSKLPP